MADLLAHVLVPFIGLTALRWRIEFDRRWIPVAMGGAAVPDLGRVGVVLDDSLVQAVLGMPFEWAPVGTLAGMLVISAAIAIWFRSKRQIAFGWLVVGGGLSLVLDGLRVYADGAASFWFYPIWWRPPTPNLYVTSDYRVTALVLVVAGGVFLVDRRLEKY